MIPPTSSQQPLLRCSLIAIGMVVFFASQVIFMKFEGALSIINSFQSEGEDIDIDREERGIFDDTATTNTTTNNNKYTIVIGENGKAPTTNGNDEDSSSSLPLCTREQIRKGSWQAVERPQGASYLAKVNWEQTCWKKEETAMEKIPGFQYVEHQWVIPKEYGCTFRQFDAERLCHILQNRTIAFLGDSLTFQQYNSLAYLTDARDILRFPSKCFSQGCANTTSRLYWLRDNQATAEKWTTMIRNISPEIVVLNRGAHYTPTNQMLTELEDTLETALEWQKDCDEKERDCVLLWRTTAPGYPDCQQTPGPITSIAQAKAAIGNQTWYEQEEFRQQFHWWEFEEQNRQVEDLIQQFIAKKDLRISFLDFYDLAILRPDHHMSEKDCLHWCQPGPMDAANTLLLHELEVARVRKLEGKQ
ncbi:unnamed protein product [Cylindrotheca closterium]|uniref:Trichome birefringence-like C-terminal domain-containing protein n=1 Tax=Cylindrotheca closterium TaxID=2856 RepID=A0AAD2PXA1_9STRA|nr:unnamed protein product [Cylindrotheca closterium]